MIVTLAKDSMSLMNGEAFRISDTQAVSSTSQKWLITTPSNSKSIQMEFMGESTGEMSYTIKEDALRTGTTKLTPMNKNRALSEVTGVKAQGTLTVDTQPTADDTMTIGVKTYTFTADGTAAADGEIDVGEDLADAKALIVLAINGGDEINTANTLVTAAEAFVDDDLILTARDNGIKGNTIPTTETFTEDTNVFDAVTLGTTTAGVNDYASPSSTLTVHRGLSGGTTDGVTTLVTARVGATGVASKLLADGERKSIAGWVLKPGTQYTVTITTYAAVNVTLNLHWYEKYRR